MRLTEIAELVQGEIEGEEGVEIERLAKIEDAGERDITFLANPKDAKYLVSTKASAVLVPKQTELKELHERKTPIVLVRVDDPYASFVKLIDAFPRPAASLRTRKKTSRTSTGVTAAPKFVRDAGFAVFASLIAHPLVGVLIETRDGTILSVNDTFCKMFNVRDDPKRLVGRKTTDVAEPNLFSGRPKQNALPREELRLRDGRVLERDYIQLASNGFMGHMWQFRDVTEQKRTEEQLYRRQLLMGEAQQIVHLGSWEWDIGTNTVTWSAELYRICGLQPDAVVPSYEAFLERVHPEDRDIVKMAVERAYGDHQPFSFNHRMIRPDGSERVLHARGEVVEDQTGKSVRLIWTGLDVTEGVATQEALRQSQQRYEALVDFVEGIVWEADAESLRLTFVSNQAERLLGYPASQWVDEENFWREHVVAFDRDLVLAKCRSIATAGSKDEFEFRMVAADGRTVWLRAITNAVVERNRMTRLRGMFVDITERKNFEAQLKESFDQLRNLAARLQSIREAESTRIALEIHDELGQALTGLKMDLAWLNKRFTGEQKPLADKVSSMLKLVDSTISTVRRISMELRPGVLDDLGLVAAIEWQADEFQRRTGIHCLVSLPEQNVLLDRDQSTAVFRILQETLTNIARHANAKSAAISMSVDKEFLTLEVRDDGIGIPARKVTDPKSLGLIGMRERASFLGGKLTITGQPTRGTTVALQVPHRPQTNK